MAKELGLFDKRHDLPVDEFFFPEWWCERVGFDGDPKGFHLLADRARDVWAEVFEYGETSVHLLVTGLTAGVCAVLEARPRNMACQVFHFDRSTGDYVLGGTYLG